MQKEIIKGLNIFILLVFHYGSYAQTYEWSNVFRGKGDQVPFGISTDISGNLYSAFNLDDEIKIDTLLIKNSSGVNRGLLLKQDAKGKILWYHVIKSDSFHVEVYISATKFNNHGNLIIFVSSAVGLIIDSDTIKSKSNQGTIFMVEINPKGQIIFGQPLIEGDPPGAGGGWGSQKFVEIDQDDNLYMNIVYVGQVKVYDSLGITTLGTKSSTYRNIIFKFFRSGKLLSWTTELPCSGLVVTCLKADIHGNVYAPTFWFSSSSSFSFNGKTISNPQTTSGAMFIWDKNGKERNWFFIKASGKESYLSDMVVYDTNSLFVSGSYLGDSAQFGSVWKKNRKYGSYKFFARYTIDGRLKWVKSEDTSYSLDNWWNSLSSMINYEDQHIYCSYTVSDPYKTVIIDGKKYPSSGTSDRGMLLKIDGMGNILWAYRTLAPFFYMASDNIDNLYFQGYWNSDTLRLGNYKYAPPNDKCNLYTCYDGFIGKLYDYSIYRGNIYSGPYCSGDSIIVPYTVKGIFSDTNVFFAEISDEFGNFSGKERTLGKFKSKTGGTIRGVLPNYQLASSGNYRIRIRSTAPQIQSFYKKDTLRLLIYSKDKADPGPSELLCKGDTMHLNTYGGTKWQWSPKYNMNNPSLRQPLVWPSKDTIYRIIISDSSGCGKVDTAYKHIFIRPDLKATLAFSDTAYCQSAPIKIPVSFKGGDTTGYGCQWYFVYSPKKWFAIGQHKSGQISDTFVYTPTDPQENLAIVLSDGCTAKADTAYLTISQRKPVTIKSTYRDTTLCTGNLLKYKATTTGGVPKQYIYQWKDLVSNSILSTSDSLKILTKKALKIQLIVNDGCEALGDTALFEVKVKPELKAITNLRDTTICAGKTLNYAATATGGNGKNYKFLWFLNNKQIDTTKSLTLTSALTSTLTFITNDNCSLNDTIKKLITVNPSPKTDFSWDLACSRTVTKFQFTGSKPNSPITTIFHWNFNNESPSYLENPSYLFTIPGTKIVTLALTSSNGCTDTIKKDVVIKPQSKADFTATDVCETDSVVFINKSQDATGYNWKFGDGQNSKIQNPKHKFQISSTTTYNVTLVAQVANGCADSISKAVTINKNPSSDFSYTYNGVKVDLKITKAGNSYQWKFGTTDSVKTTATTYTHTIKSSDQTKVCLTATDISGCSSQTCKNVSLGILKVSNSEGFKLYPNPNSGSFTIEIENPSKDASIEIFNLLGERVGRVEKVGKVNSLDLNVADGMYWVRVKNGGEVWNQKLFISQ